MRLCLRQATTLIQGSPEDIRKMGLPQWQGWVAVHSANGFKDYSGALSTVYVSRYDNKNVGRPNIVDLATHMANYQPVLTELQVRVKKLKVQRPDTTGNASGSGENCESQSKLNHIRGGGSEIQDGK